MGKLPEKEFRVMIVKMIQNLKNRMEKKQELTNTFNKDQEEIKEKTVTNTTTTVMKTAACVFRRELYQADKWERLLLLRM